MREVICTMFLVGLLTAASPLVAEESVVLLAAAAVTDKGSMPARQKPKADIATPPGNCGTFWTGWVDDPNTDVNPCPAGCERGERQIVNQHQTTTSGITSTQYEARYQCYVSSTSSPTIATGTITVSGLRPNRPAPDMVFNVPIDIRDLDPRYSAFQVSCRIFDGSGASVGGGDATFELVDHGYTGTVNVGANFADINAQPVVNRYNCALSYCTSAVGLHNCIAARNAPADVQYEPGKAFIPEVGGSTP